MPNENKIKTIVSVKVLKKGERLPEHPLYPALTQQLGAAAIVARQIDASDGYDKPPIVQRVIDEFGHKTV